MADQRDGGIAWTDQSWNPVRGCSKVSPGCKFCYAETVAVRFGGPGLAYDGLADRATGLWTGKVRMVSEHLADPLRWKRPRRVFVNSMSDLFHEKLSNEDIAAVFGVMAAAPQHTFQVLTKRAERMREWFRWAGSAKEADIQSIVCAALNAAGFEPGCGSAFEIDNWPLPNVWLGVSVEDQQRADERIPLLVGTPAAVRFISAEPLLGPVSFAGDLGSERKEICAEGCVAESLVAAGEPACAGHYRGGISWVIVGGESGPGARLFDLAWARSIVEQCKTAGTPCFMKQLGAFPWSAGQPRVGDAVTATLRDRKGGDPNEWPADLRIREFPGAAR